MENYRARVCALCLLLLVVFSTGTLFAQQDYVGRYDVFGSFSYLASPGINLYQRGFNGQVGMNVTPWLALGADYSILTGSTKLLPKELTPQLQATLTALHAPAGFNVPIDAKTRTYTAGPQVNIRHFKPVTFFVRPAIGLLHEGVTAHPDPTSPYYPLQVGVVQQLTAGTGGKSDTVWFVGFGGGFDINATKHVHLRVGVDYVNFRVFDDTLEKRRNAVRISVGPSFNFGRNIVKAK